MLIYSPRGCDRSRVAKCQQSALPSGWETAFLASLAQRLAGGRDLTPRQRKTRSDIAVKVRVQA